MPPPCSPVVIFLIFFLTFSLILLNLEIVFKSSCCGDFKKQNENDFLFLDFSKVGLGEGGKEHIPKSMYELRYCIFDIFQNG